MDQNGVLVNEQDQIGEAFTGFFSSLSTSSSPTGINSCLLGLVPKVTHDMNLTLMKQFTEEEVRETVFQMNPLGSPGSNGFPAQFYQRQWEVVGKNMQFYSSYPQPVSLLMGSMIHSSPIFPNSRNLKI